MQFSRWCRLILAVAGSLTMMTDYARADMAVLTPAHDVYITSFGGGEGGNTFMKFDISGLGYVRIDSAFLSVRVWQKDSLWDGDLNVWNVDLQDWTDTTVDSVLWFADTTDPVTQLAGFAPDTGWARTADIGAALQRDAVLQHQYTTIKLKDPDDMTMMPPWDALPFNSAETLKVGNIFNDLIYFYPSEHDSAPYLTVYYTLLPPCIGAGNALDLDGTDDHVSIPHESGGMNFGKSSFTIEAWIKNENTSGSQWKRIVTKRDTSGGSTQWWSLALYDNQLTLEVNSGTRFTAGPAIQGDGQWHYLAAVRDSLSAGAVTLCVDGVFYSAGSTTVNTGNNHGIEIGRWESEAYDGETFRGQIDEVRLWKTARTSAQLLAAMYAPLTGTESKLTACYRLDEAAGPLALDVTSNVYHGTLMNGAARTTSAAWQERTMDEDETLSVAAAYSPDGDSVTLSIITAPEMGALTVQNGVWPQVQYIPSANQSGTDTFRVAAADPAGTADTGTFVITIDPVNDPPQMGAGQALDFNGADEYAEVPYAAALNPAVFTVSLWARVDGGQGTFRSPITSRNNLSGLSGYIIYAGSDDTWQFWTGNGSGLWSNLSSGASVVVGEWVHLAAVYDGAAMHFYVDGELTGSRTSTFTANTVRPLRIGAGVTESSPEFLFNGCIDEVRIRNTALTQEQIREDRYLALQGNEANLAGYWHHDQTNGTVLTDATANGNDGTLYNTDNSNWVASAAWARPQVDEDDTLACTAGHDPDGDSLTLSVIAAPALGTLTLRHGTRPQIQYVPSANLNGQDSFSVAVTDPSGLADTATLFITITAVNDPLAITSAAVDTATEKVLYTYVVQTSQPADEARPTVTFVHTPGWLTASGDTLRGTAPLGTHGDTLFTIIADDGEYADTLVVQLAVQDSDGYVPVTLSSFTAQAIGFGVLLSWATQSEQNNLGFNVLRSSTENGPFDKVNGALVPGAGTTSQLQTYGYADTDVTTGTWYYMLEMVDLNGQSQFSNVVAATVCATGLFSGVLPIVPGTQMQPTILYTMRGVAVPARLAKPGIYLTRQNGIWSKIAIIK
jgi:hypothetical protein